MNATAKYLAVASAAGVRLCQASRIARSAEAGTSAGDHLSIVLAPARAVRLALETAEISDIQAIGDLNLPASVSVSSADERVRLIGVVEAIGRALLDSAD